MTGRADETVDQKGEASFRDLLSEGLRNGVYKSKEFHGRGVKVVNMKELFAHDRIYDQPELRVELSDTELSKFELSPGDLLFARRSFVLEGAGKCSLVAHPSEPTVFESSMIRARVDPARADPAFLYYLFCASQGRALMATIASRTAVSGIKGSDLSKLRLSLPSLPRQRSASRLLSGFDDLIANNRRRVEVLEEMGRAIYREWFVHFRYPGHENATVVESSLGPIPEGWVVSTCGDELTGLGGGTPSKNEPTYWEGGTVRWYTPSDLTKSRCRFAVEPDLRITEAGLARSSARLFPAGSVLMTSRATLGVLAIATTQATTNQGFIVIPPDERWSPAFVLHWLDEHAVELASIATGATFKEITKGAFKRVLFLVPSQDVLNAHTAATEPIEQEILNLEQQLRTLASLRDILLPKLVAGQIDVSSLDLDAPVEDSVA